MGEHTEEDIELLETRVRAAEDKDIKNAQVHIGCKRKDAATKNLEYLLKLPGKALLLYAKHHEPGAYESSAQSQT